MRSEYAANDALSVGMAYVSAQQRQARKPAPHKLRKHYGWNHKALALALALFVAGTLAESTGCMGAGCFVLCFGIRPYWK